MAKITEVSPIDTIRPGADSTIAEDGTIINPEAISLATITFDDGIIIQLGRPLTKANVQTKYQAAVAQRTNVDGIKIGDVIL
jgi:hypothetical protein